MNEPLKHKLFSVYGQILNEKILKEAWKRVRSNKGAGGVDKVTIEKFEENLDENIAELLKELKEKTYKPSPVRRVYIPKKNGKMRPLGIPTIKDRIVQQALVLRLEPFFEANVFHRDSCGFRPNRDAETALKKILWNIETGNHYIYDFDIKGYFDNIPHKKLMKVLNKYIADGTVLDIIWKSLKAGYMEDEIVYETASGTMQGGVISPLIANIYLNELDWELEKESLRFVRYADDSIVMCRTPQELERAKEVVHRVLADLGLELAEDKSDDIDFHDKDFDYLGFTFRHIWTDGEGEWHYFVQPSEKSLKKFKRDLKVRTRKTYSHSFEEWTAELNPVLRGKFNYFLVANKAVKAVWIECRKRELGFHGKAKRSYSDLDGYVRQRLRVNFANRGKKSAGQRDGKMLNVKYGNEFFVKTMGLVTGHYMAMQLREPSLTVDDFLTRIKRKRKDKRDRTRFFKYAYAR